jgi:hypothetical protein
MISGIKTIPGFKLFPYKIHLNRFSGKREEVTDRQTDIQTHFRIYNISMDYIANKMWTNNDDIISLFVLHAGKIIIQIGLVVPEIIIEKFKNMKSCRLNRVCLKTSKRAFLDTHGEFLQHYKRDTDDTIQIQTIQDRHSICRAFVKTLFVSLQNIAIRTTALKHINSVYYVNHF